jgi:hypothetical protein
MWLHRLACRVANTRPGLTVLRTLLRPHGLFLCYPVDARFADHFCSRRRQAAIAWTPYLIGWARQGRGWSLVWAVSSTERDFADPAQREHLRAMAQALQAQARAFGARQLSFAGVLPALLRARRVVREGIEAELTCRALRDATHQVVAAHAAPLDGVVVLGGRGYIGRQLMQVLAADPPASPDPPDRRGRPGQPLPIVSVDKDDTLPAAGAWLVINCTVPGAIDTRVDAFTRGSVVLNEVYPAPRADTLARLKARGVRCFHVAGVAGRAWPRFPDEYEGAIPCCAALQGEPMRVVVKDL